MSRDSIPGPVQNIRNTLLFQFQISWQLLEYHFTGLTVEEYHWRPASKGLHLSETTEGWKADWPESESYDTGPANIAWLTWHIVFWWSMVFDSSFGQGTLTREDVQGFGSPGEAWEQINALRAQWESASAALPDDEFLSCSRTGWPFTGRPFHELAAWLNLELMKNAAEIGHCRFLYAARA